MEKIQNVPQGLQSLLGTFGPNTPNDLLGEVRGVVDLTPRYNARFLTTATAGPTGGLAALGAGVTLTVPNGKAWDVVGANFTCVMAAAALNPNLELNINGCAVAFLLSLGDVVRANPYEVTVSYVPPEGLVLSPGHTIAGFIRSTPNSAITGLVRALVRELQV